MENYIKRAEELVDSFTMVKGEFWIDGLDYHYVGLAPTDYWYPFFEENENPGMDEWDSMIVETPQHRYARENKMIDSESILKVLRENVDKDIYTSITQEFYLPKPGDIRLCYVRFTIAKSVNNGTTYLVTHDEYALRLLMILSLDAHTF